MGVELGHRRGLRAPAGSPFSPLRALRALAALRGALASAAGGAPAQEVRALASLWVGTLAPLADLAGGALLPGEAAAVAAPLRELLEEDGRSCGGKAAAAIFELLPPSFRGVQPLLAQKGGEPDDDLIEARRLVQPVEAGVAAAALICLPTPALWEADDGTSDPLRLAAAGTLESAFFCRWADAEHTPTWRVLVHCILGRSPQEVKDAAQGPAGGALLTGVFDAPLPASERSARLVELLRLGADPWQTSGAGKCLFIRFLEAGFDGVASEALCAPGAREALSGTALGTAALCAEGGRSATTFRRLLAIGANPWWLPPAAGTWEDIDVGAAKEGLPFFACASRGRYAVLPDLLLASSARRALNGALGEAAVEAVASSCDPAAVASHIPLFAEAGSGGKAGPTLSTNAIAAGLCRAFALALQRGHWRRSPEHLSDSLSALAAARGPLAPALAAAAAAGGASPFRHLLGDEGVVGLRALFEACGDTAPGVEPGALLRAALRGSGKHAAFVGGKAVYVRSGGEHVALALLRGAEHGAPWLSSAGADSDGCTPVMLAAALPRPALLTALLAAGARADVPLHGVTPLAAALGVLADPRLASHAEVDTVRAELEACVRALRAAGAAEPAVAPTQAMDWHPLAKALCVLVRAM